MRMVAVLLNIFTVPGLGQFVLLRPTAGCTFLLLHIVGVAIAAGAGYAFGLPGLFLLAIPIVNWVASLIDASAN